MTRTKVKICGIHLPEEVEILNAAKPDYVGFVLAQSKRQVTPEQVRSLGKALDPEITKVGVFVDAEIQEAAALFLEGSIQMIQIHGQEDADYIQTLKDYVVKSGKNLPQKPWIIKAVGIRTKEDLEQAKALRQALGEEGILLLDGKNPGSGETFDWQILEDFPGPYILAGGLDPENVKRAVSTLHPIAVDVSSGVEVPRFPEGTERMKSKGKIQALMEALERAPY